MEMQRLLFRKWNLMQLDPTSCWPGCDAGEQRGDPGPGRHNPDPLRGDAPHPLQDSRAQRLLHRLMRDAKGNLCMWCSSGFILFPSVFKITVLRIHDILVWIRIRIWIRGSMPVTNGSGCGSVSCYFCHWPSRCQQKTNNKKSFSAYYFLRYFQVHHFSKIKSQKEVTKP